MKAKTFKLNVTFTVRESYTENGKFVLCVNGKPISGFETDAEDFLSATDAAEDFVREYGKEYQNITRDENGYYTVHSSDEVSAEKQFMDATENDEHSTDDFELVEELTDTENDRYVFRYI